ncbi:hypothetical protein D9M71_320050 [compost metagenome]
MEVVQSFVIVSQRCCAGRSQADPTGAVDGEVTVGVAAGDRVAHRVAARAGGLDSAQHRAHRLVLGITEADAVACRNGQCRWSGNRAIPVGQSVVEPIHGFRRVNVDLPHRSIGVAAVLLDHQRTVGGHQRPPTSRNRVGRTSQGDANHPGRCIGEDIRPSRRIAALSGNHITGDGCTDSDAVLVVVSIRRRVEHNDIHGCPSRLQLTIRAAVDETVGPLA